MGEGLSHFCIDVGVCFRINGNDAVWIEEFGIAFYQDFQRESFCLTLKICPTVSQGVRAQLITHAQDRAHPLTGGNVPVTFGGDAQRVP